MPEAKPKPTKSVSRFERHMKKPLLYSLIGSVITGAAFGIFGVLMNNWGWIEFRILVTTAIIAAASLCGLAADLSKSTLRRNWLPITAQVLTAISAVSWLVALWMELDMEPVWQFLGCSSILTVATVHVCLLSIARLKPAFKWVFMIAWQAIFGLASLFVLMIIGDYNPEGIERVIGVVSIAIAALTLMIPMLHRLSRLESDQVDVLMPNDKQDVISIDIELARLRRQISALEKLKSKIVGQTAVQPTSTSFPLKIPVAKG